MATRSGRGASRSATSSCCRGRSTGSRTTIDRHFTILIQAKAYYAFVSTVLLGIVVVFELPMVVLGLVTSAMLSSRTLRGTAGSATSSWLRGARRFPGADPVTTALELLPMWALFEGSIWLAYFFEKRRS